MYWSENVPLFGTHTAVTDHRCCGSIGVVTYAAVGTLTEILGNSPTASSFLPKGKREDMEVNYCDIYRYQILALCMLNVTHCPGH